MNGARHILGVTAACAAAFVSACGPQRVRTVQRPGQDLIVLLPDSDSGKTGRAVVSNKSGTVDLGAARESTLVPVNEPPGPATRISGSEVQSLFADVLATLPPPPQHFTLFFRFDSDELTESSRKLVPKILRAVQDRPVPDVVVIGHTDRTGTPASNVTLGLKRANMVRMFLREAGLDLSFIEVTSHGEADPLVPTADEVFEARNRRVEISVR